MVWGPAWRVFMSLFGLTVAMVCATGFLVWWAKRRGRARVRSRAVPN